MSVEKRDDYPAKAKDDDELQNVKEYGISRICKKQHDENWGDFKRNIFSVSKLLKWIDPVRSLLGSPYASYFQNTELYITVGELIQRTNIIKKLRRFNITISYPALTA